VEQRPVGAELPGQALKPFFTVSAAFSAHQSCISRKTGDMTEQTAGTARKSWPKVHLIYFLLASFDLVAVGGGLYLSHRLATVFEENVSVNEVWSRRFEDVWKLGGLINRISEPGSHVFVSNDPNGERAKLNQAFIEFNKLLAAIRHEVMTNTSQSISSRPIGAMRSLTDIVTSMLNQSRHTITLYEQGQYREAGIAISELNRKYRETQLKLDDTIKMVRSLQERFTDEHHAQVQRLRSFEYLIGAGLVLMVCCVAFYGHWVGRLMSSKYRELEDSNRQLEESRAEAVSFAGQLQTVNDEVSKLNRELQDNLRKLAEAQDEIVRKGKLAQLGQLTATVAHELRNPLGAVRTSAFVLQRRLKDVAPGSEVQLERINNGVSRCDTIITQLLDFSRSKSLQLEPVEIDSWLVKLVEEEAQKLPQAVEVECLLGLGTAKAEIDAARMSRVMINLLSNASEAMVGKGDAPEKFLTQSPKITVCTRLVPRGAEIAVLDNGPGIAKENLARILEPLFTTKSFGTGLGLPAVQKILEEHGGGLDIESEEGKGAIFTAWFPLQQAARAAA
jgi:signal transduction histidine kinase